MVKRILVRDVGLTLEKAKEVAALGEQVRTHIFVTEDGETGFSAESPQLPGFAFGRATITEFARDYKEALHWAGARGQVIAHWQRRGSTPEGVEYVLRWKTEEPEAHERSRLGGVLAAVLSGDEGNELMADTVRNPLDEIVFVLALQSDTLGDIAEQLDERGDAVVVVAPVAEDGLWTTQLVTGDGYQRPGWRSLRERGWALDMTIGTLMARLGTSGPAERVVVPSLAAV